ncbi:MAG: glutamate racemase [Leptolinea sp.]
MIFPAKIGIFDSGFGGLSVLRAVQQVLSRHPIVYLADQAHVPYGRRSIKEIRDYSIEITRWLLDQGCEEIIVACNTASAAALHHLRNVYPDVPFVGMEPAVKPAAEQTKSGIVGVIATPATFQGDLYTSVVERFASGVTVLESACPGLVEEIEAGHLDGPETRRILQTALHPMLEKGIDTIVLGCTHFPFVIPVIQEIAGPNVRVIDPAPAIARQAARMLTTSSASVAQNPSLQIYTTGSPAYFLENMHHFLSTKAQIHLIIWDETGQLKTA